MVSVDWLRRRCFDCEAKPHVVSRLTLLIEDKAGDKAYVNVPLKVRRSVRALLLI
jgi:aminopeptidase N